MGTGAMGSRAEFDRLRRVIRGHADGGKVSTGSAFDPRGYPTLTPAEAEKAARDYDQRREETGDIASPNPFDRLPSDVERFADGGEVDHPLGVEAGILSPSRLKELGEWIAKTHGAFQGSRFARAADEVNLEPFSNEALAQTFGQNGLYTVMHPGQFEKYAMPLPPDIATRYPYVRGENEMRLLGLNPTYDNYVGDYLQRVMNHGSTVIDPWREIPMKSIGANDLPTLWMSRNDAVNPLPQIEGHEGRHRMRALDTRGENSALVNLLPANAGELRGSPEDAYQRLMDKYFTLGPMQQFAPQEAKFLGRDPVTFDSAPFAEGGAVDDKIKGPVPLVSEGLLNKLIQFIKEAHVTPVAVATPEEVIPKLAESQRYKSQFETNKSYGSLDPDYRARTENELFDYPRGLDPTQRPIYGHLLPRDYLGSADNYGPWKGILNETVRPRTTFHIGDTLGENPTAFGPYHFGPLDMPVNKARLDSNDPGYGEHLLRESSGIKDLADNFGYVEAQIHGGLPLSDVNGYLFGHRFHAPPSAGKVQEFADQLGKPFFYPDVDNTEGHSWPDDATKMRWFRALAGGNAANHTPMDLEDVWSNLNYAEGGIVGDVAKRLIKAFHGSPHVFDKFDSSKVGSGEGAQIYGHGLYFAESPKVADFYRNTLAGGTPNWVDASGNVMNDFDIRQQMMKAAGHDENDTLLRALTDPNPRAFFNPDIGNAISHTERGIRNGNSSDYYRDKYASIPGINEAIDHLISNYERRKPGASYEVSLAHDPGMMLNLDRPISWHNDTVRDVLSPAISRLGSVATPTTMGGDFLSALESEYGPRDASRRLGDLGISGTRYWDANSRLYGNEYEDYVKRFASPGEALMAAQQSGEPEYSDLFVRGTPTRNYVSFPGYDDLISIDRRYAQGGQVDAGPVNIPYEDYGLDGAPNSLFNTPPSIIPEPPGGAYAEGGAVNAGKVSKASVDYSPGMDGRYCHTCEHYLGGSCELVRGSIDPDYWCRKFKHGTPHFAEGGSVLKTIARLVEGKPSKVKLPDIGEIDANPIAQFEDISRRFAAQHGNDYPINAYPKFDESNARRIADAYDAMAHDPHDPVVRHAYQALVDETMDQYRALADTGVDFSFLKPGEADPYARSPSLGYHDLITNGRLRVFPTSQGYGTLNEINDNPLLQRVGRVGDLDNATANDAFRIVHDALGHFGPGNPFFRAPGEERAWLAHSRAYSPDALPAATSELRGQNSWVNYGPYGEANRKASGADTIYADQKMGLLPPWAWQTDGYAQGGAVGEDFFSTYPLYFEFAHGGDVDGADFFRGGEMNYGF